MADFDTCATSVMQKSGPYDYSGQPLDIVLMDKGSRKEDYEGVDLEGKLLFLREPFAAYMDWAFTEKGAVGFVTDYLREVPGVRSREDLYDIRNYTSFWWKDWEKEPHIFGFVLTPAREMPGQTLPGNERRGEISPGPVQNGYQIVSW